MQNLTLKLLKLIFSNLDARKEKKDNLDYDHQMRIEQLKEQLRAEKDEISQLESTKKEQKVDYDSAMKELNLADGEFRSLRSEKLQQKVINKNNDEEFEDEDKINALVQKNKVLVRIAENKVNQLKVKIQSQKRK